MTAVWALTWLGQSTALAALTAAFVRLPACRSRAAARHVAWAAALFLCAGLLAWPLLGAAAPVPAPGPAVGGAGLHAAASLAPIQLPVSVIRMSWWLGWVWALGAAAWLLYSARDVCRVVRLKRRTVPLTAEERARLGLGLSGWTSRRAPRLAWCDQLDSPAVLGFSSPVIALPRSQVSSLSREQRHLVVLHELAHVRRGDDWWALAERIIVALAWVNPVVHLMARELSLSREMACDEWVVRQTAAPLAYAACLTETAVLRANVRRLRLAAGVTSRPSALRRRIVGVLALNRAPAARAVAVAAWLAPAAVFAVAAGLLQLPPVFVAERLREAAEPAGARVAAAEPAARETLEASSGRSGPGGPPSVARGPAPRESSGAEQAGAASRQPLSARSLPGAGAPGVPVASVIPGTPPSGAGAARRWSGPAALGDAMGGAGAAAGRTTASFFARIGSRVPQLLIQ
jgi:beta-lactamase regulating signal transducer with metallopeptidase domain